MWRWWCVAIGVLWWTGWSEALGGPQCGQKQCKPLEYCDPDGFCRSCRELCDAGSHNFEDLDCRKLCQEYLHDSKHGRENIELWNTVHRLQSMVIVSLILVVFAFGIIVVTACFKFYQWKRKKNVTLASLRGKFFNKQQTPNANSKMAPSATVIQNGRGDLRLDIPTPGTVSDNSPVTLSTSISRRPAEDSALDYAYDNPAMASTPPSVKPHESSF